MSDQALGFAFGISGAIFFAGGSIFFRLGQRGRAADDGHFLSILVNAVVMAVVASLVAWSIWSWPAIAAFLVAGVVGSVLGRFSLLRGIRLIGPTRSNAFVTAIPLVTAVLGWIVLGESVSLVEALGGALVVIGLLQIVRARAGPKEPRSEAETALRSYVVAAGAPTFFGVAFVIRRWGLDRMPGAVSGAFVGSVSALLALVVIDLSNRRLIDRLRVNFRPIPWMYVAAGVATSAALLAQFRALELLPAWVVGALQGTQVIWTMMLSVIVLGSEERITRRLVLNVLVVVAGVFLIAVTV